MEYLHVSRVVELMTSNEETKVNCRRVW